MRKLMIRTWFGPLPKWTPQFEDSVRALRTDGWDFLIFTDRDEFVDRVAGYLGARANPLPGTRKAGDYDPFLGLIFQDKLAEYDMWGHFNLDAVYGNLSAWLPDEFLRVVDIYGDDPGAICGPFSVYQNKPQINQLAATVPGYMDCLESSAFMGWDELIFSRYVVEASLRGDIRFASGFFHTHDHISQAHKMAARDAALMLHFDQRGNLIDDVMNKETMFYHFNQSRYWPVSP